MPKSSTFANDLLGLVLRRVAVANIADDAASSPLTSVYISLHTSDPGVGGAQTTNEVSGLTGYARLAITRGTSGWDAPSGGATANTALAQFAEITAGTATVTHIAVGTASSGAGKVLWAGALAASRNLSAGIQPQFAAGALDITET